MMVPGNEPGGTHAHEAETWPWSCLRCQGPLYHDRRYCSDCRKRTAPPSRQPPSTFVEWMREESYPSFITKVTAITSLELALTGLWLAVLVYGSSGLL